MFSNGILITGSILILAQCTQTFVLLTANIEDVKKIASKFVSEPLAQQIAEFITRAGDGQPANVSEENEENQNDNLGGDEEPIARIQRQEISSKRYRTLDRQTTRPTHRRPKPNLGPSETRVKRPGNVQGRQRVRPQLVKQNYWPQKHQQLQQHIQDLQSATTTQNVQEMTVQNARQRPNKVKPRPRQKKRPAKPQEEEERYEIIDNNQIVRLASMDSATSSITVSKIPQPTQKEQPSQKSSYKSQQTMLTSAQSKNQDDKAIEAQNQEIEAQNQQFEPNEEVFQAEVSKLPVKESPNQNYQSSEKRNPPMIMESDSIVAQVTDKGVDSPVSVTAIPDAVSYIPVKRYKQRVKPRERFVLTANNESVNVSGTKPTMVIEFSTRFNGYNIEPKVTGTTEKERNEFDQYDNPNYHHTQSTIKEEKNEATAVTNWWQRALARVGEKDNNTTSATGATFSILGK